MKKYARLIIDLVLFLLLFVLALICVPAVNLDMRQSDRFAEFVWSIGISDAYNGYMIMMGLIYFAVALVVFVAIKILTRRARR